MARRIIGGILILSLAFIYTALVFQEHILFGLPLFILGLYRTINVIRFAYSRMHSEYLYRSTARTSRIVILYQVVFVFIYIAIKKLEITNSVYINVVLAVLLVVYASLIYILFKNIKRSSTNKIQVANDINDKTQPTVTVAIPARNETQYLADCLSSIIASNYSKLEIIVLDDCSQDHASDIIKSFAHKGVRFVQGNEPGDTWLPKNAAYQKLLHEATGDIIVFCGVDVRVKADTVQKIVACMNNESLQMVSVLPERSTDIKQPGIIQLVRYMWELALPRQALHRPPVLSTLWAIDRKKLLSFGGFSSVKRMIVPEAHFARICSESLSYKFYLQDNLGVLSVKSAIDQHDTAVRVRYPQLHKRPENIIYMSAMLIFVFLLPYCFVVYGFATHNISVLFISVLELALQLLYYWILVNAVISTKKILHLVLSIFSPIVDIYLMHQSMFVYEFGKVNWKQRNVCLPVMHVTAGLPKIQD